MPQKPFSLIVAHDLNQGIGIHNTLPWKLAADMSFFKKTTVETKDPQKQNCVIMGRNTYESLPEKFRPLPNRHNIVLSRNLNMSYPDTITTKTSLDDALNWASEPTQNLRYETLFVIGGATLYKDAILHPSCKQLIITKIHKLFDCDTYFPSIPAAFKETWKSDFQTENGTLFRFHIYEK